MSGRVTDEQVEEALARIRAFRDAMVREFGCTSIVVAAAFEVGMEDGDPANTHRICRRGSIYECMGLVKRAEVEMQQDINQAMEA